MSIGPVIVTSTRMTDPSKRLKEIWCPQLFPTILPVHKTASLFAMTRFPDDLLKRIHEAGTIVIVADNAIRPFRSETEEAAAKAAKQRRRFSAESRISFQRFPSSEFGVEDSPPSFPARRTTRRHSTNSVDHNDRWGETPLRLPGDSSTTTTRSRCSITRAYAPPSLELSLNHPLQSHERELKSRELRQRCNNSSLSPPRSPPRPNDSPRTRKPFKIAKPAATSPPKPPLRSQYSPPSQPSPKSPSISPSSSPVEDVIRLGVSVRVT